jgi:hypothetical protein
MKHIRLDYLINGLFFISEIIMQKNLYKFRKTTAHKGLYDPPKKYGARGRGGEGPKKRPSN